MYIYIYLYIYIHEYLNTHMYIYTYILRMCLYALHIENMVYNTPC
jgi:hypothetical protein